MPRGDRWRFGLFLLLFVPAAIMGNPLLLLLSLLPVVQYYLISLLRPPQDILVRGEGRRWDIWTGDKVKVERKLIVREGRGPMYLRLDAPDRTKVVSGGGSRVLWKGREPLEVSLDREIAFPRRGMYHIGSAKLTIVPIFGDEGRTEQRLGQDDHILVHDRKLEVIRLREGRTISRLPLPSRGVGAFGPESTDFRDIRKYASGDRFRSINWKATARAGGGGSLPLVNQYEVEGRLIVIIMMDDGPLMAEEAKGRTALEHGVNAAQILSDLYLGSDCDVGLYAFSGRSFVSPAAGRRQGTMISRQLLELEVTNVQGDIAGAIGAFPDHLRSGPLIIMVTSLSEKNLGLLERGLRDLKRHMRIEGQVHIINVVRESTGVPPDIEEPAAELRHLVKQTGVRRLTSLGARVVDWNPSTEPFRKFLLEKFIGRG